MDHLEEYIIHESKEQKREQMLATKGQWTNIYLLKYESDYVFTTKKFKFVITIIIFQENPPSSIQFEFVKMLIR